MPRKGNFVENSRNEDKKAEESKHVSDRKDQRSDGGLAKRHQNREVDAAKKGAGQTITDLGGLIFMCNGTTKRDCFKYRVFGLNEGRRKLVELIRKGMRLFLFDVDLRLLYGIYTAASSGTYKLEPDAFNGQFPWQVRFSIHKDCLPLSEDSFKAAIKDNYMDQRKFKVELTTEQVYRLLKLFRPIPGAPGRSPPRPRVSAQDQMDVSPRLIGFDLRRHSQLSSRLVHEPADRYRLEKEGYDKSRTKYADIYWSEERCIPDGTSSRSSRLDHNRVSGQDRSRTKYASSHIVPEKEGYDLSRTKYADLYRSEERHIADGTSSRLPGLDHKSIYAADDYNVGRESRAQREIGISSGLSGHNVNSLALPLYNNDPLRPLSDLHLLRGREDLFSGYLNGRTLGNPVAEVDSLYGHRVPPDLGGDMLDRRLAAIDPLVDSYLGGLSSDILRERVAVNDRYGMIHDGLSRNDSSSSRLPGSSASGLPYKSELPPHFKYYGL